MCSSAQRRNRGRGPLAVTKLPVPLAGRPRRYRLRRRAIDSAPFFVARERQGFPLLVRAPH
jgi:hypothetical protein